MNTFVTLVLYIWTSKHLYALSIFSPFTCQNDAKWSKQVQKHTKLRNTLPQKLVHTQTLLTIQFPSPKSDLFLVWCRTAVFEDCQDTTLTTRPPQLVIQMFLVSYEKYGTLFTHYKIEH